jgi:hypothetical protein
MMTPDINWLASQRIREPLKEFGILHERKNAVINVQTVHPFDPSANAEDTAHWVCYEWPQQMIVVGGVGGPYTTREGVIDAFITAYNDVRNTNLTADDFRFFGPIKVTADIEKVLENHWVAWAIADRKYDTMGNSLEEVKENFITMWNEQYTGPLGQDPVVDTNVDWIVHE